MNTIKNFRTDGQTSVIDPQMPDIPEQFKRKAEKAVKTGAATASAPAPKLGAPKLGAPKVAPKPAPKVAPKVELPKTTGRGTKKDAPATEAAPKVGRTRAPFSGFDARTEATPARKGTKVSIALDHLSGKTGVTAARLSNALSQTGAPVQEKDVNAWLSYDIRNKGYGVEVRTPKTGDQTYHLVLPAGMTAPHPHKDAEAPKPKAEAKVTPVKKGGTKK